MTDAECADKLETAVVRARADPSNENLAHLILTVEKALAYLEKDTHQATSTAAVSR